MNQPAWPRRLTLAASLAALLVGNFYLRHRLEDSHTYLFSFLEYFYAKQIPIIFGQLPTWRLFLPLRELTGSWCTTTLLLTYKVERLLTPGGAWELYNALSILVAFGTSWLLFRSAVFSLTLAICIGFGTQFYHAYAVSGGISSYLVVMYHMLLLASAVQVVRGERPRTAWWLALAASLALNVLGYEGWLDVLVLVWVASPFVYIGLRRLERPAEARRLVWLTVVMTLVGIAYVVVKAKLGYGQTQGSESDVVFNYQSLLPVIDDFVANVFTHTYLSVSNFLPPVLVGSSAFYWLGPEALVSAQHKYHEPFTYLVIMNQVFFWRFYAGAAFAIVVYALYATAVRAWQRPSAWTMALGVFLMMILVGAPTHTLIKFRPMNSEPVMTYHVTVGVLGMSLVIAWLLTSAWQQWHNRRLAALVIGAVWATIFYGALARPPYLSHMAAQSGLGNSLYPNPMRALIGKLGGTYTVPRGLLLYRLMPYQPDDDLGRARALLADLPLTLPPVEQWTAAGTGVSLTRLEGGGIEVAGDATQIGYQMLSPVIPVQPATRHLLRVRFEVRQGRVCAGVLTGDQQRWVVPADGTTVEYAFDSGDLNGVRVVLTNCYIQDLGNPRSKFRLDGGSYAAVVAQP